MRDIAGAVDISEGALYRHFVSKEELVWQLFERHYVAFAGRLQALADGETTARGKLGAMIRGFCQAHDDDPTLFHFLLFVQHGQLSKLASDVPTPVTVMHAMLSGAIAAGEIPPQDADLATALVMGDRAAADDVCRLRPAAAGPGPERRSAGRGRVGRGHDGLSQESR